MSNKEFRLEVLRMVLETGTGRIIDNPMERANKYLQWCEAGDKPKGPLKNNPSKEVETSKGPRKTQ